MQNCIVITILIPDYDDFRWMYARNWDDFLQRDCKAFTFPRAFAIWAAASLGFATGIQKLNNSYEIMEIFVEKIEEEKEKENLF